MLTAVGKSLFAFLLLLAPVAVTALVLAIPWRVRERLLWGAAWVVLVAGVAGATYQLLSGGALLFTTPSE